MVAFDYPAVAHQRGHGPQGYERAITYRPWLRDEFTFRCVYCLLREQWGRVTGEFDVEHFRPQVNSPELGVTYDNLLYACHTCNLLKGDKDLPDPSQVLTAEAARVNPEGVIAPVPRIMRLFWAFSLSNPPESPSQEESSLANMPDTLEARCRSDGPPAGPRSIDPLPGSRSFLTVSAVA